MASSITSMEWGQSHSEWGKSLDHNDVFNPDLVAHPHSHRIAHEPPKEVVTEVFAGFAGKGGKPELLLAHMVEPGIQVIEHGRSSWVSSRSESRP